MNRIMKYSYWIIALVAITLSSLALLDKGKTAFIVNERVFKGYNGTKELEIELTAMQTRHRQVLDSLELEIKLLDSDNQKVKAGRVQRYQRIRQEFTIEEEQKSKQYTDQIWKQLNQFIKEFGETSGYDFVLGTQGNGNIMYAKDQHDITEQVIKFINGKYEDE